MSGLCLLPLGVGDAFSARYYSSCLALQADDGWLLLDCPHPIRKIMAEASAASGLGLDVDRVLGVVLTHLHGDHCSGVEGLGFYARYLLSRRMPLLAHPEVSANLWSGHLAAGMEWSVPARGQPPTRRSLDDFFQLIPLDETRPVQIGPFAVECHRAVHSIPATSIRVRVGGRSVGYSGDTAFDPALVAWLAEADLVVHETSHGHFHTPYDQLASLPASLRAKMRLIHYPDSFDLDNSLIEPLRQGRSCAV